MSKPGLGRGLYKLLNGDKVAGSGSASTDSHLPFSAEKTGVTTLLKAAKNQKSVRTEKDSISLLAGVVTDLACLGGAYYVATVPATLLSPSRVFLMGVLTLAGCSSLVYALLKADT
jgi:hypothetical protein